jgi:glucose/arabinose dehydrogenase
MKFMRTPLFFMSIAGLFLLTACSLTLTGAGEPPHPTIVSEASPLPPPTPTAKLTNPPIVDSAPQPTQTLVPAATTVSTPEPPPPTDTPASVSAPALESLTVNLLPVASGFAKPVHLTHAGDDSERLFVVEQPGRILIVQAGQVNPVPFLDITDRVGSEASEQGLLSAAFHPRYADNGLFFVNYTNKQGDTVLARYQALANPNQADPSSAKILLTIAQPYANHNGGQLAFGPDGYLYMGTGDGGSANDPHGNGQNLGTLLGKILRLDVDNGDPYGVPESNPFVGQPDARPEIWSFGWRNPWRFSFDPAAGDMFIADVGQNQYEEVHFEPVDTPGGQNYGWRLMEGLHCFNPPDCNPATLPVELPITEYSHQQGCSVTGGFVYRGSQFPALTGIYFYGDYCTGTVWGVRRNPAGQWEQAQLLQSGANISSFGQDEAGEVYLVTHQGDVFQLGQP